MARFEKTFCSQCGGEFGPGEAGFSHCKDHMTAIQIKGGLIASVMDYGRAVADELTQRMQQSWLDDIKEKMSWLEANAYAEGRRDEAEEQTAIALIDAWVQTHGKPIPWESAVQILAIVNKMPDAELARLLALGEDK